MSLRFSKFLTFFLLLAVPAYASFYPVLPQLDRAGVSTSSDLTVPCPSGQVMKSSGGGLWACGTDSTGAGTASAVFVSEDGVSIMDSSAAQMELNFALGFDFSGSGQTRTIDLDPTEKQATKTADGFMRASDKTSLDIVVAASHDAVTLAGTNTYITLSGQQITRNDVSLGFHTSGSFAAGDAEFGAATSGDSAAAFFPTGAIEVARGGTALGSVSNDAVLVGNNGGTGYDQPALPNCADTSGNHLNYTAATGNFTCGTSSSGGTPGWTDNGTLVRQTTSGDNVIVGGNEIDFGAKFQVDGKTDVVQALIRANGTQTAKIFTVENSTSTDLFTVSNDGSAVATAYGQFGGTDQSVLTEGLLVNDGNGTDEDDDFTVKASGGTYEIDAGAGTFISTTNDAGWSVQAAANQACTTTCASACLMGFEAGALGVANSTIVACSDATADKCLCMGAS